MSLTKSYDIWCDWPGCPLWVHGVVAAAGRSGRASNEARLVARSYGWRRVTPTVAIGAGPQRLEPGKPVDLCPRHAKEAA